MSDLNNTTMTGRLVRAPVLRNARNGTPIALFTIAANQRYEDKNGKRHEESAFVLCKAFGGWAKAISNCQRGDMLMIAGRLRTESWQRDDAYQSQLILLCDSVFRAANERLGESGDTAIGEQNGASEALETKDEIPF